MATRLLSGNEAIARGALEAGVSLGAGYPGTPSTEILESLAAYNSVYCEWSPNEKVALEVAVGASLAGARAIATMKHVGLNVAADPLFSCAYMGVNGGLVVVSADDPGMHSSQNEQDNRLLAAAARIPLIEPSTPEECRLFARRAFELSERFDTPVLLRTTTRLSHGRAFVGSDEPQPPLRRSYTKNREKNVVLPAHARARHRLIEEQRIPQLMEEAERWCEVVAGSGDVAFITSGVTFLYVREAFPDAAVLKLGMTHPLPKRLIREFAKGRDVLVVEELEPFLEQQVRALGIDCRPRTWPRHGELSVEALRGALAPTPHAPAVAQRALPARPPALCPGCSHRGTFHALGRMGAVVTGDIGCYTLAALPPLDAIDSCMNMGASIGMAHGFAKASADDARPVVAVIGDSTFFHSGITGLLDVAYNGGRSTVVVLDNRTTAMTGHQGHPGTGEQLSGGTSPAIDIAPIVRAVGIEDVREIDPYDLNATWRTISEAAAADHPTVIIARAPCVLKERKTFGEAVRIDTAKCTDCHACTRIGCPAIALRNGKLQIDPLLCIGCGHCQQVCADCNAGIDIPLVLELVELDRIAEAIDVLLRTNPLPATTARICPHPCEHPVNALGLKQRRSERFPSARAVEQWLGDEAIAQQFMPALPALRAGTAAVIGSGPAGLSAAWQLRRRGWRVTVIDRAQQPGGLLRYGIPEFRLERAVLDKEIDRLRMSGIEFRCGTRVGNGVSFEQLRRQYDAVVIATGDAHARVLSLPGAETAPGCVLSGLELLERFNTGEPVAIGARAVVVGGGNTAIDAARVALRLGAAVTVLYRRTRAEMPAIPDEVEAAIREGVRFEFERVPVQLHAAGDKLVSVQSARVQNVNGRLVEIENTTGFTECDTIVAAIGEQPDLGFLADSPVRIDTRVLTNHAGRTSAGGVFACGDVAFGYGTVGQAIASGRKTAETVSQYLEFVQRKKGEMP
ncbi:MAG TPA: indolepyruvate ferredoxin oxidoreductase subunit alpha [Longimicrobiales bacterium]